MSDSDWLPILRREYLQDFSKISSEMAGPRSNLSYRKNHGSTRSCGKTWDTPPGRMATSLLKWTPLIPGSTWLTSFSMR